MVSQNLTSQDIEETMLAEQFHNAMRGFIVIEESGLPKYIEFLTEEKIDVVLLAGLLSGLQSLAEVISEPGEPMFWKIWGAFLLRCSMVLTNKGTSSP